MSSSGNTDISVLVESINLYKDTVANAEFENLDQYLFSVPEDRENSGDVRLE